VDGIALGRRDGLALVCLNFKWVAGCHRLHLGNKNCNKKLSVFKKLSFWR
jgi:hypothetical protein